MGEVELHAIRRVRSAIRHLNGVGERFALDGWRGGQQQSHREIRRWLIARVQKHQHLALAHELIPDGQREIGPAVAVEIGNDRLRCL